MNGFISLLNNAHAIGEFGLHLAIVAGFTAGVLALVVLSINLVARRWLTAGQMGFLWGLVLLRMALPFAPASPFSVQSGAIAFDEWLMSGSQPDMAAQEMYHQVDAPLAPATADLQSSTSQTWVAAADGEVAAPPNAIDPSISGGFHPTLFEIIINWLPLVWLVGVVTVLGMTISTHWRFARRLSRVTPSTDARLLALWNTCCEQVHLTRQVPILVSDEVSQPAVMGVFRPWLLLPTHSLELTDRQLRMVMLHELMHIRRWDVAVNWLLVLVRATQWWNPFFWLAACRYGQLREQSRDAMVLQRLSSDEASDTAAPREYAELLLSLAGRGNRTGWRVMVPVSLLGLFSGLFQKRAVAGRLKAMRWATRRQLRVQQSLIVTLIACIAAVGLTDAAPPSQDEVVRDLYWPLHAGGFSVASSEIHFGDDGEASQSWASKEYDVTTAVATISEHSDLTVEEALREIRLHLLHHFSVANIEFLELLDTTSSEVTGTGNSEIDTPRLAVRNENDEQRVSLNAPESVHRSFRQAIAAWEQSGIGQVSFECRLITSRGNVATTAGIGWDSIISSDNHSGDSRSELNRPISRTASERHLSAVASVEEHVPMFLARLEPHQVRRLIETAQGDRHSNTLYTPKVTLFNGQSGTIFSGVQRPFAVGMLTDVEGNRVPQLKICNEGLELEIAAKISADHTAVDIDCDLRFSNVIDVQTVTTVMEDGEEVTLQIPRLREMRIRSSAEIVDSHSFLIGLPPSYDREEFLFVLLTPKVLELEED